MIRCVISVTLQRDEAAVSVLLWLQSCFNSLDSKRGACDLPFSKCSL